ncbi:extra-large guanine nucleotide-binding protein 1-like [Diospyros lotus]|uniref:extra-large guanine nucleotide-binding protein 1-like n=1 Tax=Diospyros lotus TaxID=55363 RepID=UPI002254C512|nr:extra-large guanine nucleotide-binding protein 1-like [Diospyros lotus]
MTTLLRKLVPVPPLESVDDGDDYSVEYSFAMEYSGPLVSYDIPRVVPVDVRQIPTASAVPMASMFSHLSVPVVQPFVKSDPLANKLPEEFELGSGEALGSNTAFHSGEFVTPGAVGSLDGHLISCKSVDVINDSSALGSAEDKRINKLSDGSSGTLGFSDSQDDSQEISGSSEVDDLNEDGKEGCGLNEGDLGPQALSSEISSNGDQASIDESQSHVSELSTMSSCSLSHTVHEGAAYNELSIIRKMKKGLCHRCLKANRFTKKEECIVCGARYCFNCVLRAMGSMPEGRKCVTCIRFPIDESRRRTLGKCSRLLKQLLTDLEVKVIMRSEISCEVNHLPPHLVRVNGKPLCHEELVLLQTCLHPPRKLRPGNYWYDKVSGFWGKEGQKPCQIISAQLAVGNSIMRNASNGNTNVLINNREITEAELRLLKFAGIHCEGNPHFWVSPDGSYQEEGQKNVMPKIWEKTGIKLYCAFLSLPIPPEGTSSSAEEVQDLDNGVVLNYLEQKPPYKLLLVGCDKSGTSTIFKQARMMFDAHFSEIERQNIKLMIQTRLYAYLGILLEGREQFEEECLMEMRKKRIDQPGPSGSCGQIDEKSVYSISLRLKAFSDWLLQVMISGNLEAIFPAASREYAPLIEELWNDKALQATYNRRNELPMLPRVANYFLDRAVEISRTDYEPSDLDILYAEGVTLSNGISSMEFSFPKATQDSFTGASEPIDSRPRYQLIRLHASSLGENCKWLEMFEDIDLVLYCVSLTEYDEFLYSSNGVSTNKMLASKKLFERIVTHPTFYQKNFLLILNKFDLLEEKIEQVPLSQCEWFHDFKPVISLHPHSSTSGYINASMAQRAFHHIAMKFKRLFHSLTERKLYVSLVTGLEPDSVDKTLRYAREILKWDDLKRTFPLQECSSGSIGETYSS